jgi:hypothetical protein
MNPPKSPQKKLSTLCPTFRPLRGLVTACFFFGKCDHAIPSPKIASRKLH